MSDPDFLVAAGYVELVRRATDTLDKRLAELQTAGDRVRLASRQLRLLCDRAELAIRRAAKASDQYDAVWAALESESRHPPDTASS